MKCVSGTLGTDALQGGCGSTSQGGASGTCGESSSGADRVSPRCVQVETQGQSYDETEVGYLTEGERGCVIAHTGTDIHSRDPLEPVQ